MHIEELKNFQRWEAVQLIAKRMPYREVTKRPAYPPPLSPASRIGCTTVKAGMNVCRDALQCVSTHARQCVSTTKTKDNDRIVPQNF